MYRVGDVLDLIDAEQSTARTLALRKLSESLIDERIKA